MMLRPSDLTYVRWRAGIWKAIGWEPLTDSYRLRWVTGPRPDHGVFHDVKARETTPLNEMEILGLMAIEGIVT